MKKDTIRAIFERKGYKLTTCMSGKNIIAKKGQSTYTAETLNGLYKKVFK